MAESTLLSRSSASSLVSEGCGTGWSWLTLQDALLGSVYTMPWATLIKVRYYGAAVRHGWLRWLLCMTAPL